MSDSTLDYEDLKKLVKEDAVAIRGRATLLPAGGPGDKVFPPTHSVDDRNKERGAKYAFEDRRIDGNDVKCVLLDSVQSQANRMEEALQMLWAEQRIALPVITVDLSGCAPEVGLVTSLTAPHRIADALLRDSLVDGKTLFRMSEVGRSFTDATPKNAAPLFNVCPTSLVFGLWDSTGPKGGLGSKFARALVSEIVGVGARFGVKTSSRIDPTGIINAAGPIFEAKETAPDGTRMWTPFVLEAQPVKPDKPPKDEKDTEAVVKWKSKNASKDHGKPTAINHSNIPPSIDALAGGVTIDYAIHTVVLSIAALRKLHLKEGFIEARVVLAALGLIAVLAAEDRGHDLRSRCLLVPKPGESLRLEAVRKDGSTEPLQLDLDGSIRLYEAATAALPDSLRFKSKPGQSLATLLPSPKLAHLIRESRKLATSGADVEGE